MLGSSNLTKFIWMLGSPISCI